MEEKNNQVNNPQEDINQGKQIAWLSYLGILVIVPIIVAPQNEYVKFHARQGIALLILEIIWVFVEFFFSFMPIIKYFIGILNFFIWLGVLVLVIMGIVYSVQGEKRKLPIIGDFAESLNFI